MFHSARALLPRCVSWIDVTKRVSPSHTSAGRKKVDGCRGFLMTVVRMVEGPGLHSLAIAHRQTLLGQRYTATSPSGRFTEGAMAINGKVLTHIEAHGKNIFYFFTQKKLEDPVLEKLPANATVVHIHFGFSGAFITFTFPGPEPREKTRLRLVNEELKIDAHLRSSICKHGNLELYKKRIQDLGPDPLREDADKEIFWENLQRSKRTIGALLMDQSMIAGIGNIYRAELLFVVGVHPNQRASNITRETFELLWFQARRLLRIGVLTGSIITVSPDEIGKPFSNLRLGDVTYVYNHRYCRRCGGIVHSWKCAQRTVYACENCQTLSPSENAIENELVTKAASTSTKGKRNSSITNSGVTKEPENDQNKMQPGTLQGKKKQRNVELGEGRMVEHQAFKGITTSGFVDYSGAFDDEILKTIAPQTEGTRKVSRSKFKKLEMDGNFENAGPAVQLETGNEVIKENTNVMKKGPKQQPKQQRKAKASHQKLLTSEIEKMDIEQELSNGK